MNPEELGRFFEAALQKIEPADDRQREKLDRFREMMRSTNRELAQEVAGIREDVNRLSAPVDASATIERATARERIAKETNAALLSAFEEQTDLIRRISSAGRRD